MDGQVKYLARGQGYSLFLTPAGAVLGLQDASGKTAHWVRLTLHGAASASITAEDPQNSKSNYFRGTNPAQWHTAIPTFGRVRYERVYPGVDLVYYGHQGRLENDFELAAGADPQLISWKVDGVEGCKIVQNGDLALTVGGHEVRLLKPRAYQGEFAARREVEVRYRLSGQNVGFELGNYDPKQKLVIDPVLTYSTYLGSTGGETGYSVAIDGSGDAFVTGVTASTTFPVTAGVYQTTYAGDADVFVTEFAPDGRSVIFSTFLGGTGTDTPAQILLDSSGNIYLVGTTTSSNFPTTSSVFQPTYAGNQDAFLTEMKPDGSALIFSTYIGGTGTDFGTSMAFDASGDIYVTGSTNSTDFPTKNPLQLGNAGLYDAYVTEVNSTGGLVYSTYLGGHLSDYGTGIAVNSAGDVYVSGYTYSNDFPTQSAMQSTFGGGSDVFLTKFTPGSSSLLFSTYIGGTSLDMSYGMIVDSSGAIYLAGTTQSPNFPTTANAFQSSLVGTANAFVTKVAQDASTLTFSTLYGGSQIDQANALALDNAGNIYITGFTQSSNFPLRDAFQNVLGASGAGNCGSSNLISVPNNICSDAFVAKFAPTGLPSYSSFLGGNGADTGQGIAVDSTGAVYVTGGTASTNFPATAEAYQSLYAGTNNYPNAFLAKVSPQDAASVALTPQQINFGTQPINSPSQPITVTLTNVGSSALNISSITASGDFAQTNTCGTSVSAGSGSLHYPGHLRAQFRGIADRHDHHQR